MVFSSVPVYLDPPHWQQQANHQWPGGSTENSQFQAPQPLPTMGRGGGGTGSIRPNSMAERARLAKIPQPEAPLKCPRCDSTNTKFCYFNNYSLSQPRHFCKTCRRYWTRGGAMRNVPVGGGCRRNKRSKRSNRSKSPAVTNGQAAGSGYSSAPSASRCTSDIIGHLPTPQLQIPLVPTLHQLSDYNSRDIGLNFGGIRDQGVASTVGASNGNEIGFQGDSAGSIGAGSILSSGFVEQWKLQQVQQFPFLSTGLEQATGLYSFESEGVEPQSYIGQPRSKTLDSGVTTQLSTVKMEEIQALSLSRNFLGISENDQYWSSNAWTDISGYTSSSTSHLL